MVGPKANCHSSRHFLPFAVPTAVGRNSVSAGARRFSFPLLCCLFRTQLSFWIPSNAGGLLQAPPLSLLDSSAPTPLFVNTRLPPSTILLCHVPPLVLQVQPGPEAVLLHPVNALGRARHQPYRGRHRNLLRLRLEPGHGRAGSGKRSRIWCDHSNSS